MMFDSRGKHRTLFYIGVANFFVGLTRYDDQMSLTPLQIYCGKFSFAYHASYTLEGQIFDFVGMYGYILLPVVSFLFLFSLLNICRPLTFDD